MLSLNIAPKHPGRHPHACRANPARIPAIPVVYGVGFLSAAAASISTVEADDFTAPLLESQLCRRVHWQAPGRPVLLARAACPLLFRLHPGSTL